MGWAWFIPIFHMSAAGISQIHLQRSDFDFPLGPGAWIVDADISLVWAPEEEGSSPPARQTSAESQQGIGGEPPVTRLAAVVDAATGGVEGLAKAGGVAQAEE